MNKIIVVLCVAYLIFGGGIKAQNTGTTIDEIAAIVGDKIILKSYIEGQRVQLLQQRYFTDRDLRCQILEDQLYTKLLLNQAEIDSIEVSNRDVEIELDRRINYIISQLGSEAKVEDYFGKSILEIREDFNTNIKEQMISQRMQAKITADIKVTPTEVRQYYESLPKDSIPIIPTTYELQQIVRYPKVDELEVLAVKTRLEEFRERIKKGENFATLAVLYSADQNSARKGGELGYVGRGDLVPEFANVAFKLQKGEVSRIVKTEYGYHIIQLIDRKGERINVRHILLTPKVKPEERLATIQFLDSVRTLIVNDSLKFEDAVARFSQDKETRNGGGFILNQNNNSIRFEQTEIESSIASVIKDKPEGFISEPFETIDQNNKTVIKIVRIRRKIEAHQANLVDDFQILQEMALNRKKEEFIGKWIKDKRESTYIRISDEYKNCDFQYPWFNQN
ncbi:MAG TPA: peptidylprolyl isomerase [Salinivirgaceae bacterium]|nr:peptidylprolyl isomerase [Salinivirgaceae bacterium]